MNALIAIMTETHARVLENEKATSVFERAKLILVIEQLITVDTPAAVEALNGGLATVHADGAQAVADSVLDLHTGSFSSRIYRWVKLTSYVWFSVPIHVQATEQKKYLHMMAPSRKAKLRGDMALTTRMEHLEAQQLELLAELKQLRTSSAS
jgi:hypothetical protein